MEEEKTAAYDLTRVVIQGRAASKRKKQNKTKKNAPLIWTFKGPILLPLVFNSSGGADLLCIAHVAHWRDVRRDL